MTTYPLNPPPIVPSSERLLLVSNQTVQIAEFSGHTAIIDKYTSWTLELNFTQLSMQNSALLSAWIDGLRGASGTFLYQPWRNVYSQAGARTLYVVCYAGSTIAGLTGWGASAATGLVVGQFISIAGQLHRITVAPSVADSAGHVTIEFSNPTRADHAIGTAVNFSNPTGTFRRSGGNDGFASGYQVSPGSLGEFATFTAQEAF